MQIACYVKLRLTAAIRLKPSAFADLYLLL